MDFLSYYYDGLHYFEQFVPDPAVFYDDVVEYHHPTQASSPFFQSWRSNDKLAAPPQQPEDGYQHVLPGFDDSFETRRVGSGLLDASYGRYFFDVWPHKREDCWQDKQSEVPLQTEAADFSFFLCPSDEDDFKRDTNWMTEGIPNIEVHDEHRDPVLPPSTGCHHSNKGHPHRIEKKRSLKYKAPYKRTERTVKGLTMCMRTLLRQLLAGTGWIVDASICRDRAICLIKILIGPELEDRVKIDLPMGDTSHLPTGWKERHYTGILAKILSYHLDTTITIDDLEDYITLRRGPYRLSLRFKEALDGKQWPPFMPQESELRSYGCYRFGEASSRRSDVTDIPEAYRSNTISRSHLSSY